ncbi:hypothetical protein [Spirilliplanes yamanashiensis]|uniref:DUF1579 domain-containing protein n=1 Tax=Spirilliplanes yamanashiensis TaxID=42233 RepID=A0A8J3Y5Q8_9ACTN|nr:hypothetical protein [Spirilliplanes yamanashiensis]MDP9819220.1 hypothetical protein [Spirilliplanes yamanashiensis]GIJ01957.1 hypothetical protein Sya03_13090 [Spirilliplanes yamanashiensis]
MELTALAPIIGRWRTEGRLLDPGAEIAGTDTYEWVGTGFVVHTVDVTIGGRQVDAVELIGSWDDASGTFAAVSYDGDGTVAEMRVTAGEDGVFGFADDTTRATLVVSPDGAAATAGWERRTPDGVWEPWMEVRLTRLT